VAEWKIGPQVGKDFVDPDIFMSWMATTDRCGPALQPTGSAPPSADYHAEASLGMAWGWPGDGLVMDRRSALLSACPPWPRPDKSRLARE
jgi:hypothetical protein